MHCAQLPAGLASAPCLPSTFPPSLYCLALVIITFCPLCLPTYVVLFFWEVIGDLPLPRGLMPYHLTLLLLYCALGGGAILLPPSREEDIIPGRTLQALPAPPPFMTVCPLTTAATMFPILPPPSHSPNPHLGGGGGGGGRDSLLWWMLVPVAAYTFTFPTLPHRSWALCVLLLPCSPRISRCLPRLGQGPLVLVCHHVYLLGRHHRLPLLPYPMPRRSYYWTCGRMVGLPVLGGVPHLAGLYYCWPYRLLLPLPLVQPLLFAFFPRYTCAFTTPYPLYPILPTSCGASHYLVYYSPFPTIALPAPFDSLFLPFYSERGWIPLPVALLR